MGKHPHSADDYILKLYVSGASPNSLRAIDNLQHILETHLAGKYQLTIIDVRQDAAVAEQQQIIALPMLIKASPLPERRLIGDMSDLRKVLNGLGING
ncbi:circadian clock protein KaiB [Fulvivirgaceae bacterium PWU5]|uniref:Circadian clock protein KaiB n=1 Tax=Dawidia cretensis TaxID=2782350 RepID=A0AAP2E0L7_9BACT|nr:circadian clock KaiB family protein [Dawidia cretensis]MBT1709728.1 circadian clock protein KaiB [Dawidia cretensis]